MSQSKLEIAMNNNDKLSFRKLAAYANINHALILKRAHEPVIGQIYDPNAINWQAVEKLLTDKKIDIDTIDWAKVEGTTIELPSKEVTLEVGDKFELRYKPYANVVWQIIIKTATHVCIMAEGSTEPKCMSHNTLNVCGIKPIKG